MSQLCGQLSLKYSQLSRLLFGQHQVLYVLELSLFVGTFLCPGDRRIDGEALFLGLYSRTSEGRQHHQSTIYDCATILGTTIAMGAYPRGGLLERLSDFAFKTWGDLVKPSILLLEG